MRKFQVPSPATVPQLTLPLTPPPPPPISLATSQRDIFGKANLQFWQQSAPMLTRKYPAQKSFCPTSPLVQLKNPLALSHMLALDEFQRNFIKSFRLHLHQRKFCF